MQVGGDLDGDASEDGAFALFHPRVVFHQLWVQKRVVRDAFFYPLEQPAEGREGRGELLSGHAGFLLFPCYGGG